MCATARDQESSSPNRSLLAMDGGGWAAQPGGGRGGGGGGPPPHICGAAQVLVVAGWSCHRCAQAWMAVSSICILHDGSPNQFGQLQASIERQYPDLLFEFDQLNIPPAGQVHPPFQ